MAEYYAILAAILTQPDEDTPRLAMADWFQENGQPDRGEFIRLQCQLARRKTNWPEAREAIRQKVLLGHYTRDQAAILLAVADTRPDPLQQRERELSYHYEEKNARGHHYSNPTGVRDAIPGFKLIGWDDEYACYSPDDGNPLVRRIDVKFHRGFVREIRARGEYFVKYADDFLWPPTAECPTCANRDARRNEDMRKYGGFLCVQCHTGHPPGRVPNPVPPPASVQPIKRVVLTTHPTAHVPDFNALRRWKKPVEWGGDIRDSFEAEWPWLSFVWPGEDA